MGYWCSAGAAIEVYIVLPASLAVRPRTLQTKSFVGQDFGRAQSGRCPRIQPRGAMEYFAKSELHAAALDMLKARLKFLCPGGNCPCRFQSIVLYAASFTAARPKPPPFDSWRSHGRRINRSLPSEWRTSYLVLRTAHAVSLSPPEPDR
jgi:hypothetical protein